MKLKLLGGLFACTLSLLATNITPSKYSTIKKVVIWGHVDSNHTHHWIHYAYYRTFKHLGFETYWLNDVPYPEFDFSNTLFFAHGIEERHLPRRQDCRYILHNAHNEKNKILYDLGNAIRLQVYTHACLEKNVIKIEDYIYADHNERCIYMPWATDLLPHEIDAIKTQMTYYPPVRDHAIYYVGTVGGAIGSDPFENSSTIFPFLQQCEKSGYPYTVYHTLPAEEHISRIQHSYLAPALQGPWQCQKGYIPCRIFKNISYGHMGITNSETVYELFKGKILYDANTAKLAEKALEKAATITQEELFELMDFVRDHHTYINRLEHILNFMNDILPL